MIPTFSTIGTILTSVRRRTGIGSNPVDAALQEEELLRVAQDIENEYVNFPIEKGMLGWKYLMRECFLSGKANTTLNGALSLGASTVVLTSGTNFDSPPITSDYPNLGGFYIKNGNNNYDFGVYESKSTHTLSTVALLGIAHSSGEEVHKLYVLPSDFGKSRVLFRQSPAYELNFLDEDWRQVPPHGFYMIKTLAGTNYTAQFVVLPYCIGTLEFKMIYQKAPGTLSSTSIKVSAPDGNGRRWFIEKMKAYVWNHLGETEEETKAEALAAMYMEKCLTDWATQTIQKYQSLELRWE